MSYNLMQKTYIFLCTIVLCAGCFALCCLPVFTCKVTKAVGACPCLPLLDCIGCVPPASLAMRASVRQRYGIQVARAKNPIVQENCQKYVLVCPTIYHSSFKPNSNQTPKILHNDAFIPITLLELCDIAPERTRRLKFAFK